MRNPPLENPPGKIRLKKNNSAKLMAEEKPS